MKISTLALDTPTEDTLETWLNTPRYAKCGVLFTPSEPMWRPDRTIRNGANWEEAIQCVSLEWQRWMHAALALRMEDRAQGTVNQTVSVLLRAAKEKLDPLNPDFAIDFRERFNVSEFASLVRFLEFWHENTLLEKRPTESLIEAYRSLPRKKRTTRDVILSLDPEEGPFTKAEQNDLYYWLNDQFSHGNLKADRYLYVLISMHFGQRSVQNRMMTFSDFFEIEQKYFIRIFFAKKRGVDSGWRRKSRNFGISKNLYETIKIYEKQVLNQLKEEYPGRANWEKAIPNIPLFRSTINGRGGNYSKLPVIIDLPELALLEKEPHMSFHVSGGTVRAWLTQMEEMPNFPISARTQKKLIISKSHRFRHTLGTDMSIAGYDEWTVSHALMHSRPTTVRKYRQVSPELMNLIDEKLSDHVANLVSAFTGKIVINRESAINGDRADRQIEDLAVCGSEAACHLDAPFTCYACSKFQPFLDADHTSVLERLERRRKQTIANDRIAAAVWDRAILACRKVILECETLRETDNNEK